MSRDRRAAERAGRLAEYAAAARLILTGHRILLMRFKAKGGEIDIVARRGGTVALIEVKRRPSLDEAIDAVGPRTRRRIEQAARTLLAARPDLQDTALRFDIIASAGWRLRHVKGAWLEGD